MTPQVMRDAFLFWKKSGKCPGQEICRGIKDGNVMTPFELAKKVNRTNDARYYIAKNPEKTVRKELKKAAESYG